MSYHTRHLSFARVSLPVPNGLVFVNAIEIIRCEASSNYTKVILTNSREHLVAKTLSKFSELLPEELFMRVHASHLVNLKHLNQYTNGDGGYLTMSDDSSVTVSRNKKAGLLTRVRGLH